MKLIIDIDEKAYKTIMNTSFVRDVDLTFKQSAKDIEQTNAIFSLIDAMDNGTPIPDNATNGDVIKAIFDVTEEHFYDEDRMVDVYGLDRSDDPSTFYADWWNAPYQKGGKE